MKSLLGITRALGVLFAWLAARAGVLAVVAVGVIIVVAAGVGCWIIASADRSDRVARLLLAMHGDARCLQPSPAKPKATRRIRARASGPRPLGRGAAAARTRPRAHR